MKKKRLFAMFTACALSVAALAGCGSSSSTSSSKSASSASSASETVVSGSTTATSGDAGTSGNGIKVALIQQHQTNAFQIAVSEAAEAKAKELGVELTILSADQDAAKQISEIEQCVSEKYDAILFEPVDPDGLGAAAQEAADAGVVVINIISACTDWQDYGISALSCGDNVAAGELEMEQVAKQLNGKGNIAILTGPSGDSGGLQRMEGYENVLKKYPDIKQVVEPADCQWDTAQAQSTVESWLSAYDLDAIVAENDGMAVGAGNAAGANSGIIITGVDGTPDGFEAIGDGRITGTVSQNGGEMASNAIEAAVKLVNGEKLDNNEILTECTWIDSSNVKDFE
jgi:inositol transport system substrate-binding protein